MPCLDGREPELEILHLKRRLNSLTELMCNTCADLEAQGLILKVRGDAQEWWRQHKLDDEQRKTEQDRHEEKRRIRDEAVSGLSPEQVAAIRELGIEQ